MTAPTPTIVNGFNGGGDVMINGHDYACVFGDWRGTASKSYYSVQTFCTGAGWRAENVGMKSVDITSTGYLNEGTVLSDPMLDFNGAVGGVACVFSASASSSIAGNGHVEVDFGVAVNSTSTFVARVRSTGAWATTWKTTP